jgi:hypothetical protein
VLLWIAIKGSVLLCVAALVQFALFRRASAAARHVVWTLSITCVLLLPVVSIVVPEWPLVTLSARQMPAQVRACRSIC